jgi:hypothetical protein
MSSEQLSTMAAVLTTTFSPPSQCTTDIWKVEWSPDYDYFLLGGEGYSSCLPASFEPTSDFFFTPGLHCPDGYFGGSTRTANLGAETESIVICCPSGFSVQESGSHAYAWESTLGCTSACSSSYTFPITDASSIGVTSCTIGGGVNAYSVQLRFRETDLVSQP